MSLFSSLVGDFEDDPFFGSHMQSLQRMNSMMNSMFADPFGLMGPPAIMGTGNPQSRMGQMPGMQMMPFGFPPMPSISMGRVFSDLQNMSQDPNCQSFTSSSIMTMTSGPDGQPQVYQESMSTRTAPGGIKETKKTVRDSRTGTRKMAIGHHIGDRAHILEREQNMHSGDQEERQEFINIDEEEAESFNQEWETKIKHSMSVTAGPSHRSHNPYTRGQENRQLALPSSIQPSNQLCRVPSKPTALPRRALRPVTFPSKTSSNTTSGSSESIPSNAGATFKSCNGSGSGDNSNSNSSGNSNTDIDASSIVSKVQEAPKNPSSSRKREHSPEPEILYSTSKRRSDSKINQD